AYSGSLALRGQSGRRSRVREAHGHPGVRGDRGAGGRIALRQGRKVGTEADDSVTLRAGAFRGARLTGRERSGNQRGQRDGWREPQTRTGSPEQKSRPHVVSLLQWQNYGVSSSLSCETQPKIGNAGYSSLRPGPGVQRAISDSGKSPAGL